MDMVVSRVSAVASLTFSGRVIVFPERVSLWLWPLLGLGSVCSLHPWVPSQEGGWEATPASHRGLGFFLAHFPGRSLGTGPLWQRESVSVRSGAVVVPWVTPISSFACFQMDKAPQLSPREHLKTCRDDRQEKERAVLSSSSQGERYKAAAGSSCATASHQLSTASCLRASKMEPLRVTCPRCPALGAAGGRGSEKKLKLAVPSSSLPELGPQTTSRPKIEPAEAGAKEGRGPWRWRLGGEHSTPGTAQEEASAPSVTKAGQSLKLCKTAENKRPKSSKSPS